MPVNTENLGFALLAFIPALMNAGIIFYIFFRLPRSRTTDILTCFVFGVLLWQLEDGIVRVCLSADTARFWDSVFCIGWLGMAPLALHFAVRYTGLTAWYSRMGLFLIYGPFVVFEVLYVANNKEAHFYRDGHWGWVSDPRIGTTDELQRYWMSLMIIGAVFILIRHAMRLKRKDARKYQAWLIAFGIFIPGLQGIITQVFFPLVLNIPEIPVTSTFMTFFSLLTIIAFSKYKSLNVSESIQSHTLLENLNKIVFIISPEKKIVYCNLRACAMLGVNEEDASSLPFSRLFHNAHEYNRYVSEVFNPVIRGKDSNNYASAFLEHGRKKIDVLVTSRLVVNNNVVQGVLLVASDISDHIRILRELEIERMRKEKEITHAVLLAQEKERKTIGGELHDNVNQILATSKLYLNMMKKESGNPHPFIDDVSTMIENAISEIRTLSHSLIPPSLKDSELTEALDKIIHTAGKSGSLNIEKDLGSFDENTVPEKLKLNIYRIVQEQFNNIIKYAHANTIHLKLVQQGEKLILKIRDDGVGFDTSQRSEGVGLTNMKTRASLHNGKLRIVSAPGKGCELTVLFENVRPKIA
jgi:PAS domain S-box-containing protein